MTAISLTAHLAAPPAAVYQALTDGHALRTWLAEQSEVSLADGIFQFWGRHTPHGEEGRQRLLDTEPDKALRFEWTLDGAPSRVEITLEPDGSSHTRLRLAHTQAPARLRDDEAGLQEFWALSLGNLANHVEGRALAPRCDFTRFPSTEARAEVTIHAPTAEVYGSLVEPERLDRWIAAKADVDPEVGGRYDFGWDHGPVKILELEPGRALAYSWHNDDWPDTVVRWELADSGGHTHLTIVHSGFSAERPADGYQIGWQTFLIGLKRMHENAPTIQPVDWS